MESHEIDIIDLIKKVWQTKAKIAKWSAIGMAAGIVVAISIPKTYLTEIIIAPEEISSSSRMDNMGALAGMMGVNIGSNAEGVSQIMYPEILKSTPFLLEFYDMKVQKFKEQDSPIYLRDFLKNDFKRPWWSYIAHPNLVMEWIRDEGEEKVGNGKQFPYVLSRKQKKFMAALSSSIQTSMKKKEDVMIITSAFQDPLIAAQVADSVFQKLQAYMTKYRTTKSRNELQNTQRAFDDAKQVYQHTEAQYAEAKDRNQNLISQSAKIKVDQLGNERNITFGVYQQLSTQLEVAKIKLLEETPIATVIEPARVNEAPMKPKKMMIIAGFTALFALGYIGTVLIKEVAKQE